jgi:uncharacterized protein with HEPN domain
VLVLQEIERVTAHGARLVARGRDWYDSDPDNVPGLAAESLIIKLGENAARLDADFIQDHPQVPWRAIKDMRNRLTHQYDATDYQVVWTTIRVDFPELRSMVRAIRTGEG